MGSALSCFAALARASDDSSSPAACTTLARRSRSASACLAIARFISGGKSTCLISIAMTSIPQFRQCLAIISCRSLFNVTRSDKRSSSSARPSTLRKVVWAISEIANPNSSTSTIALSGSVTRKVNTALT